MDAFVSWINTELNERGWSRSEAARRGGFSPSTLDKVIGGFSGPGPTLCRGLARAFERPPDEVFRLAGILPMQAKQPRPVRDSLRIVYEIYGEEVLLAQYHALIPEDQTLVRNLIMRLGQIEPRIIGDRPEE